MSTDRAQTAADIPFEGAKARPVVIVELSALLTDLVALVRRYVVITEAQAVAIALWVAHTHAIEAADCTPYLQITSATKRAGKTRLLEVLEPVVARPWFTGRTSASALVRKVNAETPTLLLDESDAAFGGEKEYAEALRGILNTGYRRSGKATLCVGPGANIVVRDFSTFCPKAIVGIGELPGTLADRAIRIELRRRTTDEPYERWRERDGHAEAAPLRQQFASWAEGAIDRLRDARPVLPAGLGDRQEDVWEPLLAVADLAGGSWPTRARSAAIALAGSVEDTDIHIELLYDIKAVFEDTSASFMSSTELVAKLCERDDRPWATWRKGQPITGHGLARILKTFGVVPIQNTARTARGYYPDRFEDAWLRYPPSEVSNRLNANKNAADSTNSKCREATEKDTSKTQETPTESGSSDTWTLRSPGERCTDDADRL